MKLRTSDTASCYVAFVSVEIIARCDDEVNIIINAIILIFFLFLFISL